MSDESIDAKIARLDQALEEMAAQWRGVRRQVDALKRRRARSVEREASLVAFQAGWLEAEEGPPN